MEVLSPLQAPAVLLATCAVGAALTYAALRYARSVQLLDAPGRRRSHVLPTPRGGGAGPVLAWIVAMLAVSGLTSHTGGPLAVQQLAALLGGTFMVALVGAVDDHHALPALPRLFVHCVAASGLVLAGAGMPANPLSLLAAVLAVVGVVAVLNFWNFMDGINGIASMQTAFVAAGIAVAAAWAGDPPLAMAGALLAAAVLGFLPFNFPRARIFLGDVGSGALGFAVAGLLLLGWQRGSLPVGLVLLLPSAFLLDAGLTLLSRMLRGRRWYTAHREHLYQWLVRSGGSHARVVALFLAWNFLIVTPLCFAVLVHRATSQVAAGAALAVGAGLWFTARALLLRRRSPRMRIPGAQS